MEKFVEKTAFLSYSQYGCYQYLKFAKAHLYNFYRNSYQRTKVYIYTIIQNQVKEIANKYSYGFRYELYLCKGQMHFLRSLFWLRRMKLQNNNVLRDNE